MVASQKKPRGGHNFFHTDLKQPFFRCTVMRERGLALRMTQRDGFCAERPRTQRVRGTVDSHHWNAKCGGQMQRPGVTAQKDTCAAGECNELPNRATQL